jgi:hypothetical protein
MSILIHQDHFTMKTTILLTTALAAFGLTVLPVHANDAATKEKPAAEAAAENTATVYIVNVKGKG